MEEELRVASGLPEVALGLPEVALGLPEVAPGLTELRAIKKIEKHTLI